MILSKSQRSDPGGFMNKPLKCATQQKPHSELTAGQIINPIPYNDANHNNHKEIPAISDKKIPRLSEWDHCF